MARLTLSLLAAMLAFAGVAAASPLPGPDVTLAPRPAETDIARWSDEGAERLISLLTPEETAALGYDIEAEAAARGMAYSAVPVGPETGGAAADALALILAAQDGPVVIACASARRASHLYAASLIRSGAIEPGELDRIDPDLDWSPALLERLTADSRSDESAQTDANAH
jgi:protein tyrosine phosphatase (PTP) superfamily phosphohydrolase (DUF442 family)